LFTGLSGIGFLFNTDVTNVTINHNTIFNDYGISCSTNAPSTYCVFTNNIFKHGANGIYGDSYAPGNSAIKHYFPNAIITKNVLVGVGQNLYPTGNFTPAAMSNVGFIDYVNADYHLSPSSLYPTGSRYPPANGF